MRRTQTDPDASAQSNDAPLVTIITITYNHADLIGRALESFVAQKTDFPFQVLVADDCSTDGAQEVIRAYAAKYPDIIKPIMRKKNIGPEENFLSTAEVVRSKYVAICDGDDYFVDDQKLRKQVALLEADTSLSICYGYAREVWADGSREPQLRPPEGHVSAGSRITLDELVLGTPRTTSTIMYRWRFRDECIRDHMAVNIQPGDDYLMFLHAEVGGTGFIEDVLSVYWRHETGLWYDRENDIEEHLLKQGMPELFFHYYVYRRFVNEATREDWRMRTINAFTGVVRVSIKYGKMEELAKISTLGDRFFSEFGDTILITQMYLEKTKKYYEQTRRRRRTRKAWLVFGVLLSVVLILAWLAFLR